MHEEWRGGGVYEEEWRVHEKGWRGHEEGWQCAQGGVKGWMKRGGGVDGWRDARKGWSHTVWYNMNTHRVHVTPSALIRWLMWCRRGGWIKMGHTLFHFSSPRRSKVYAQQGRDADQSVQDDSHSLRVDNHDLPKQVKEHNLAMSVLPWVPQQRRGGYLTDDCLDVLSCSLNGCIGNGRGNIISEGEN